MQKQLPEAENGNGKNTPTWKWITIGICLPLISWFASGYFNNVQGQFTDIKKDQESKTAVLHSRLNKMDEEKVDKDVLAGCLKGISDKLDYIVDDLRLLKRAHQKP